MTYKIILGIFAILLLAAPVLGAGVGLSPSRIIIENAFKGGEYQRPLRVALTSNQEMTVALTTAGNASSWVTFYEPNSMSTPITSVDIPAGGNQVVMAVFRIPTDAPNGNYNLEIFASSVPKGAINGTGSAVSLVTTSVVRVVVTGNQVISGDVRSISMDSVESGQNARIKVDFKNTGNVMAKPAIMIDIFKDGRLVDQIMHDTTTISTNQIQIIPVEWSTEGRGIGPFLANVTVYLQEAVIATRNLTFNVEERGTYSAEGSALVVRNPTDLSIGKTSKIEVDFYNSGKIDLTAKIIGEVYVNGQLTDTYNGEEVMVKVGEQQTLTAYVKPSVKGDYVLKTKVSYAGKAAPLSDFTFTIGQNGAASAGKGNMRTLLIILVALVVLAIGIALVAIGIYLAKR